LYDDDAAVTTTDLDSDQATHQLDSGHFCRWWPTRVPDTCPISAPAVVVRALTIAATVLGL
jgi:hypothetical protein